MTDTESTEHYIIMIDTAIRTFWGINKKKNSLQNTVIRSTTFPLGVEVYLLNVKMRK